MSFGQVAFGTPARLGPGVSRTFETRYFGVESQMATSLWRLGDGGSSFADSAGADAGTAHGIVNAVAGLVPGDSDGAVSFPNSSGNYIDAGTTYSTLLAGVNPFSLVAVVQPSFLDSGNRRIMSMMTASSRGVMMYASNGYCGFYRGDAVGSENQYKAIALPLTSPTHIVCTYDGATMRVYFNGVQAGTGKASSRSLATLNRLYIGNDPVDTSLQPWQGVIDEAMLCTYALSQAQVTALWTAYQLRQAVTRKATTARTLTVTQAQAAAKTTARPVVASQAQAVSRVATISRIFTPTYVPLLRRLMDLSVWSLDETTGNYADLVGAVTGTPEGPMTTRGVAGLVPGGGGDSNDRAVQMNSGTFPDYIDFGLNYGFPGRAPFSFVLAYKPSIVDSMYRRVICADSGGTNHGWSLQSVQDELLFLRGDASGFSGTQGPPLVVGQTYLIVGTYDGAYVTLYVNGALQTGVVGLPPHPDHVLSTQSLPAQTNDMCLGYGLWPGGPAPGTYDYFALCDYALNAAQVGALWGAFNRAQAQAVTRLDSIPAFRMAATQAQSVTRTSVPSPVKALAQSSAVTCRAALARGYAAAQGAVVARVGSVPQSRSVTQSAGATVRQDLSRTVTTTQAETVAAVGGGPRSATFTLMQGAVVTRRGAVTATRALAQDQEVGRIAALSVVVAQVASAAMQRSIGRRLAVTQPQTATRPAIVARAVLVTQASTTAATGVIQMAATVGQAQRASIGRVVGRALVKQQGALARLSRNVARTRKVTQAATLATVHATARSTFTTMGGQVVILSVANRTFHAEQAETLTVTATIARSMLLTQDQRPIYFPRLKHGRITVTDRSPRVAVMGRSTRLATSVQGSRISVEVH